MPKAAKIFVMVNKKHLKCKKWHGQVKQQQLKRREIMHNNNASLG